MFRIKGIVVLNCHASNRIKEVFCDDCVYAGDDLQKLKSGKTLGIYNG